MAVDSSTKVVVDNDTMIFGEIFDEPAVAVIPSIRLTKRAWEMVEGFLRFRKRKVRTPEEAINYALEAWHSLYFSDKPK
ncbi:MAG: hypothetical protein RML46_12620 [Anaerolineae bacterium]|nr:hypothetical protein [Anaerolineae bacterium]